MTEYSNENSGALFKNDKKLSEKHPDYKGTINVGGAEFWLSSWIKTSKAGTKYMSLSLQPKDCAAIPQKAAVPDFDDSVPF